jgi:acid phosphatase type 7
MRLNSLLRRSGLALAVVLLAVIGWQAWLFLQESSNQGARGPYLQMSADNGMTLRWNTDEAEVGMVRYGEHPDNLTLLAKENSARTTHELRLRDLKSDTRYWYAVGNEKQNRYGGTPDDWFVTAPKVGVARPLRFWVQGDPGYATTFALDGRDAMLKWVAAHPRPGLPYLDLWFTTGDNAYSHGRNREYQLNLFDVYPKLLANIPYWPVFGNHDARRWAFFDIFSFPTQGESGGVPSGSEHYYAIDYGQVHFVVLDSHHGDRTPDGDMLTWLKKDLAATKQPWLIALFHHPPYTKGSHDSDNPHDSHKRMIEMRENAVPILEAAGVDLVLSGHSHVYERSMLIDCHYGDSTTFKPSMILGKDSPFHKPAGLTPHSGTIYNVVGSTARANNGPLDHPAMAVSKSQAGSLIVDVAGDTLTAHFITAEGKESDSYSIVKKGEAGVPHQCH